MTPARAATYFVGASLLAAWLASAAGVARPQTVRTSRPSADSTELDSVVVNVQSQTTRLRQRLAGAPSPQSPMRNPFTFAARATPPPPPARARKPAVAIENPPLPELELVLIGIAEQGTTRTAMIESGNELLMASEGQTLAGRYRVGKVSIDALELVDLETGAIRRLFLRSPA
jgi:hypothetical protein